MANVQTSRFITLLHREFREYKNSLFWTPVTLAIVLGVLMLGSVILANRVAGIGDTILETLMREDSGGVSVSFSVTEDTGEEVTVVQISGVNEDGTVPDDMEIILQGDDEERRMAIEFDRSLDEDLVPSVAPAPTEPAAPLEFEVLGEAEVSPEQWEFSREWSFNPEPSGDGADDDADETGEMSGRELNVMLSVVHGILLLVLLLTTLNYLLSSLFDDRKDRSILFWRSMPVTELEIVLSKLVVALVVAPIIYIAISLLLQLAYVLLMMLLVWRMDQDPFAVVLENIDFIALMIDPISGWLMTALLIAPTYAWLLCASALARRSPFLMAIAPVIGLAFVEAMFIGTDFVGDAVQNHIPHMTDTTAVGFYLFGPDWGALNLGSVGAGLVFTALAIGAAVWLRQHRWELN